MEPVHPRASGERRASGGQNSTSTGSSPRERGTGLMLHRGVRVLRFIPARAGNGVRLAAPAPACPVHPRASGERAHQKTVIRSGSGSSPRERGTDKRAGLVVDAMRFIPARAGNGAKERRRKGPASVHPRASGERSAPVSGDASRNGSSPRERGTGALHRLDQFAERFIPARAGNGRPVCGRQRGDAVHPRASGERGVSPYPKTRPPGSSPRERGTDERETYGQPDFRFIPARAGNGVCVSLNYASHAVHPRASGERPTVRPSRVL